MAHTICIRGNVATEPRRKQLPSGDTVVEFRLAATQRRFDAETQTWADGNTSWFSVSAFRALGENVFRSISKGEPVVVSGRLSIRSWTTKDDRAGTTVQIDANAIGHDLTLGISRFQRPTRLQQDMPAMTWEAQSPAQDHDAQASGTDSLSADTDHDSAEDWAEDSSDHLLLT